MLPPVDRRYQKKRPGPLFPDVLDENRLVDALENIETLEGHSGCVNTLRWNKSGRLLASGSDDRLVKIWRAGAEKCTIETGHEGNVFAVEFLPSSDDRVLVTGAADCVIGVHDIESKKRKSWESEGRIKRICTVQNDPHCFWAASENDKRVIQFDTRTDDQDNVVECGTPTNPSDRDVKSVCISEARPNLIAVGYDETAVRLFDRRNFERPLLTFAPLDAGDMTYHATHVAFNKMGTEVVVNHGCGGGVFVFNVDRDKEPRVMERLHAVLAEPKEPVIASSSLPHAELREIGTSSIRGKHFAKAIDFYSDLIMRHDPDRAFRSVCHSNRATALLLRRQRGDTYACIRECVQALELHRGNSKALFRLIKSFSTMEHVRLAKKCIAKFKEWFPGEQSIAKLEEEVGLMVDPEEGRMEMELKNGYVDYQQRFGGSTNFQTDIKEANFFGSRDQFIVAGSDCGHMYIWNRDTAKIQGIWKADGHILNICQPHPEQFLLATSGIDEEIRLWQPLLERPEEFESRKVEDQYEFLEKRHEHGGFGHGVHMHVLREFMRESPQCVQS